MDLGLDGKVALVTGASSGLGLAIALALANEGVQVAMVARGQDALERAAAKVGIASHRRTLAITASDIMAYVASDPDTLFKVAVTAAGTSTIGSVARTAVGNNSALIQTAGNTTNGNSLVSISSTTATTNTLPVRIIDVVDETKTSATAFTEVIVKWNAGMHQYNNATGV